MDHQSPQDSRSFVVQWTLATWVGWLLGLILVLVLAALGEAVGVGSRVIVGVGMGAGVGYAQWRVARKWFDASSQWIWATIVGLGAAFALLDVIAPRWGNDVLGLQIGAALGGLLAGIWQSWILSASAQRASYWSVVSLVCWTFAAAVTAASIVGGHPSSALGIWRNLAAIAVGGVTLGVSSGWVLARLLSRAPSAA